MLAWSGGRESMASPSWGCRLLAKSCTSGIFSPSTSTPTGVVLLRATQTSRPPWLMLKWIRLPGNSGLPQGLTGNSTFREGQGLAQHGPAKEVAQPVVGIPEVFCPLAFSAADEPFQIFLQAPGMAGQQQSEAKNFVLRQSLPTFQKLWRGGVRWDLHYIVGRDHIFYGSWRQGEVQHLRPSPAATRSSTGSKRNGVFP